MYLLLFLPASSSVLFAFRLPSSVLDPLLISDPLLVLSDYYWNALSVLIRSLGLLCLPSSSLLSFSQTFHPFSGLLSFSQAFCLFSACCLSLRPSLLPSGLPPLLTTDPTTHTHRPLSYEPYNAGHESLPYSAFSRAVYFLRHPQHPT